MGVVRKLEYAAVPRCGNVEKIGGWSLRCYGGEETARCAARRSVEELNAKLRAAVIMATSSYVSRLKWRFQLSRRALRVD